jgi:hypothetical protein
VPHLPRRFRQPVTAADALVFDLEQAVRPGAGLRQCLAQHCAARQGRKSSQRFVETLGGGQPALHRAGDQRDRAVGMRRCCGAVQHGAFQPSSRRAGLRQQVDAGIVAAVDVQAHRSPGALASGHQHVHQGGRPLFLVREPEGGVPACHRGLPGVEHAGPHALLVGQLAGVAGEHAPVHPLPCERVGTAPALRRSAEAADTL